MIDAPGCTGELSNILGNKCVPSIGQNGLRQPILPQEQNHGNYGITAKHYIDFISLLFYTCNKITRK